MSRLRRARSGLRKFLTACGPSNWRDLIVGAGSLLLRVQDICGGTARYGGFRVYHGALSGRAAALSVETIRESLALIQKTDPRRFARLQRHFACIIAARLKGDSDYFPLGRTCLVNPLSFLRHPSQEGRARALAISLVGQSTRAAVLSKAPVLGPRHPRRLSRICLTEEIRFARRLADPTTDWEPLIRARDERVMSQGSPT